MRMEGIYSLYRSLPARLLAVVPMIGIQCGAYALMTRILQGRQSAVPHSRGFSGNSDGRAVSSHILGNTRMREKSELLDSVGAQQSHYHSYGLEDEDEFNFFGAEGSDNFRCSYFRPHRIMVSETIHVDDVDNGNSIYGHRHDDNTILGIQSSCTNETKAFTGGATLKSKLAQAVLSTASMALTTVAATAIAAPPLLWRSASALGLGAGEVMYHQTTAGLRAVRRTASRMRLLHSGGLGRRHDTFVNSSSSATGKL